MFWIICYKNVIFLFSLTFITVINHKSFYILKTSYFICRMFEIYQKGILQDLNETSIWNKIRVGGQEERGTEYFLSCTWAHTVVVKPLALSKECFYLNPQYWWGEGRNLMAWELTLEDWICKFTWLPETGRCVWVPNNVWTNQEELAFLHDCGESIASHQLSRL